MGLLDQYFDPEMMAAVKSMNQLSEEDKIRARNAALGQMGFAMLANNRGQSSGQAMGNALGHGGMAFNQAYQGTLDEAKQNQMQQFQMAGSLQKMKKDQEQQQRELANQDLYMKSLQQFTNPQPVAQQLPKVSPKSYLDISTPEARAHIQKVIDYQRSIGNHADADGIMATLVQQGAIPQPMQQPQPNWNALAQLSAMGQGMGIKGASGAMELAKFNKPDYMNVDTGNGVQIINKNGQVPAFLPKGLSPDSVASNQLGRDRLQFDMNKELAPKWDQNARQFVTPPSSSNPNGAAVYPTGIAPKDLTGEQGKAAGFVKRMVEAEKLISQPSSKESPSAAESLAGSVPFAGDYLSNQARSPERQMTYQAQQDWVRAKLRKESGAVIGKDEMADEIRTYFPVQGDSQEVIAQKAQSRRVAMDGINGEAGAGSKIPDIKPRSKQFKVDGGKAVIGMLGEDGNYYVKQGGKKFRIEE